MNNNGDVLSLPPGALPLNHADNSDSPGGDDNQLAASTVVPLRCNYVSATQKRRRVNNSRLLPAINWMAASPPVDPSPPIMQSTGPLLVIAMLSIKGSCNYKNIQGREASRKYTPCWCISCSPVEQRIAFFYETNLTAIVIATWSALSNNSCNIPGSLRYLL